VFLAVAHAFPRRDIGAVARHEGIPGADLPVDLRGPDPEAQQMLRCSSVIAKSAFFYECAR